MEDGWMGLVWWEDKWVGWRSWWGWMVGGREGGWGILCKGADGGMVGELVLGLDGK